MAEAPPTSRLSRTGRVGGLVAGQGLRWAGTRAANLVRSPERAEAATGERAAAFARELVEQLGRMRGAAMKIGQVLSTVDFTAIPEAEREEFKRTLASLRDDVPPLPWSKLERLVRSDLGGPVSEHFAEFEHEAFAAPRSARSTAPSPTTARPWRSRCSTRAWPRRSRSICAISACCCRWSSGWRRARRARARRRAARARGRGLDYGRGAEPPLGRACLARASVRPRARGAQRAVEPPRARHRAARGAALRRGQGTRRGRARPLRRIVFRFFFGTLDHLGHASGDPHPGDYLLLDDGRVGFLDFGLMRTVDPGYLTAGRRSRAPPPPATPAPSTAASPRSATSPSRLRSTPRRCWSNCGSAPSGTSSPVSAGSRRPT